MNSKIKHSPSFLQRSGRPDGGEAFLPDFTRGGGRMRDEEAEAMAEEFIAEATSAEFVGEDARDEFIAEEMGGPFVESESEAELQAMYLGEETP